MSTLPSSWPEGPTLRLLDRADEPLVAPVEVAAAAPQAFLGFRCGLLRGLLARPGQDSRLGIHSRHLAVHGLFEACLLLGLEQWVVVERIRVLVVTERHRLLELGVPLLQLEMILNDLGEDPRRLNLHTGSWARGLDGPAGEILALQTGFSTETAGELRVRDGLARCLDPVLPGPFRLVHGRIRCCKELGGHLRGRNGGHPEAGADRDRAAVHREQGPAAEQAADALGQLGPAFEIGPRQDENELLPTPAAGEVDVPDGLLEECGELSEDRVAGRMAVPVVDVLEPIEVGDDDGQGPAEPLDPRELVFQRLLALAPVGETREAVDQCLSFDDSMQACVVERDHGMRSEGNGSHAVLLGELGAEEEERTEADRSSLKRYLEALWSLVGKAGLDER